MEKDKIEKFEDNYKDDLLKISVEVKYTHKTTLPDTFCIVFTAFVYEMIMGRVLCYLVGVMGIKVRKKFD